MVVRRWSDEKRMKSGLGMVRRRVARRQKTLKQSVFPHVALNVEHFFLYAVALQERIFTGKVLRDSAKITVALACDISIVMLAYEDGIP